MFENNPEESSLESAEPDAGDSGSHTREKCMTSHTPTKGSMVGSGTFRLPIISWC